MTSLALRGEKPEWADIAQDLAALQEVDVDRTAIATCYASPLRGLWQRVPGCWGRSPLACPGGVMWCQGLSAYTQMPSTRALRETNCRRSLAIADKHFPITEVLTQYLTSRGVGLVEAG